MFSSALAVLLLMRAAVPATEPLLKDVRFKKISEKEEKVFLVLNGPYLPESLGLRGATPRITCDFKNVRPVENLPSVVETNGTLILRVRVGVHGAPEPKTRVVLDLAPHMSYHVAQDFFQQDTTFVLTITPDTAVRKKPTPPPSANTYHK